MDKENYLKRYKNLFLITVFLILIGILFIILNQLGIINLITKVIKSIFPVFIAIILSFLFEPLIKFFEKRNLKRSISVLLVYGLVIILFVLIVVLFIPPLFLQIKEFLLNLPILIDEIHYLIGDILSMLGIVDLNDTIKEVVSIYTKDIFNDLSKILSKILYFFMAYVGALFLSFDYNSFKRKIKKLLPNKLRKHVQNFFDEYTPFIYKYLKGVLYDTFLLWSLSTFVFFLTGLEYAIIYGLILSIFNLIPIIGSYIGGIPAILVALTISPLKGLYVFLSVIVVQTIESNFMNPYIMKNVIKLHPLEGLFSLLLLGSLFGFVGMVISPLFWVAIKIISKQYKNNRYNKLENIE